jgi:hypothetical protein
MPAEKPPSTGTSIMSKEPRWITRLAQLGQALVGNNVNRRQYRRYDVSEPVHVAADGKSFECSVDNVSTGGARLVPALPIPVGSDVVMTHPSSTMIIAAKVVGGDPTSTRIAFDQPTAGAIVSAWMRAS